jgi:hypothetical protein
MALTLLWPFWRQTLLMQMQLIGLFDSAWLVIKPGILSFVTLSICHTHPLSLSGFVRLTSATDAKPSSAGIRGRGTNLP